MCEFFKNLNPLDWWQIISATLALFLSFTPSFVEFKKVNGKFTGWGKFLGVLMIISLGIALKSTVQKINEDKVKEVAEKARLEDLLDTALENIKRSDGILNDLKASLALQNSLKNNTNNLINNYNDDKGLKYQKDLESYGITFNQIITQAGVESVMMEGNYYKFTSTEDSIEAVKKITNFTQNIINLLTSQIGNPILKENKKNDILWNYYLGEMIKYNSYFSGYAMTSVKELANKISRSSRRFMLWSQQFEFERNSSYIPGSGLHYEPDEYLLKEKIEAIK